MMIGTLMCQEIEEMVCERPLVQSCLVVGEEGPYYSALIMANKTILAKMLREDGPQSTYNLNTYQGINQIEIRSYYCDLLEEVNRQLPGKRIERFALLEWSANQTREAICKENKRIIESFYQEYIPGIG